ncbi:MAG: RNA 2',3'-cyclic phosphodiesterase [Planctomycetes bacterium]|nr:RNA 2',3'-cyclic phosphodiesterase [Planctomycetota bacterium]
MHLTLRFPGDTAEALLPRLAEALLEVAATEPPFDVAFQGLGAFPKLARPSVVWAGIRPPEPCIRLEEALTARLTPLGFATEARAYRPHLTLARVKGVAPSRTLQNTVCQVAPPRCRVFLRSFADSRFLPMQALSCRVQIVSRECSRFWSVMSE